jgi:type III pantothenate kinase
MPASAARRLICVDIGNSRMKIGRFEPLTATSSELPEPDDTFDSPIIHQTGEFDTACFFAWCDQHVSQQSDWMLASVHRGATERLKTAVKDWSSRSRRRCTLRHLSYRDVPLAIHVEQPERVGIDRLLGALAANHLRRRDQAAIVVDLGTAITIDLLEADGSFTGGAILPGIAMSARALAEQTDALPLVTLENLDRAPARLGKSTIAAIESGLFWGAIGAIREIAFKLSAEGATPDLFITGGGSPGVAKVLSETSRWTVRHVPHLVLGGIALVDAVPQDNP